MREVLREEKKFLINYESYAKNSMFIEKVLTNDEHNGFLGYKVRSLYFDTLGNKDYNEKNDGVELRRKIRIRVYNPSDDFAYLEMKQKQGKYQMKRSLKISKTDTLELIKLNYDVLLKYDDAFASECFTIMSTQNYIPRAVVEYNRKAFIAKENNIRITFDSQIVANEANFNIFDEKLPLYPVFPYDSVVLEVKYNGFLLSYIKDIINNVDKSELSVSKYCLARSASMEYVYC